MKKLALFLLGMLVVSCIKEPERLTKEYFKAQYRDPNLTGKWHRNSSVGEFIHEYTASGELFKYKAYSDDGIFYQPVDERERKVIDYYYYTKGNVIFRLIPAEPFKRTASDFEDQYIIKGDTLIKWPLYEGGRHGDTIVAVRKK